ncbi:hypothetical protein [Pleomorphovibrio marinus]|uniref:hypothetical protein n=1 Tax=Pleomorphovibrio marinus TaxID=2164132 RepID=UPI001300BD73|nr:hypothetical protein [Pleomorphovibrio marinus]
MGTLSYRILCRLRFRHDYFLNSGTTRFEEMGEEDRRRQLDAFDWRTYWDIKPTPATKKKLARHQVLIKSYGDSLLLLARNEPNQPQESFVPIPAGLFFTFYIFYKDSQFEQYTDMPFMEEECMLFSNRLPEEPSFAHVPPLPLSEEDFILGDFIVDREELLALLEEEGESLPGNGKGILQLYMEGGSGDWNIMNSNGTLKVNPTVFWLKCNNRQTYWRYLRTREALQLETLQPKPLTKSGFVEINPIEDFGQEQGSFEGWHFPNPSIRHLKRDSDRLISEIHL